MKRYVRTLAIAGSDSGGGAGIQADLKTFSALGCYGMTAITAVTAQNTQGVTEVAGLPPAMVRAQIDAVLGDIGADAVKVGLLFSAEIIETVADSLEAWGPANIVLDPVIVATSGDRLLRDDATTALRTRLLPLASVITPNIPEAESLVGAAISSREGMESAARALLAWGAKAALVKGGHLAETGSSPDVLAFRENGGVELRWFESLRVDTQNTHGTGCTLSSAITAFLAHGHSIPGAVDLAKRYLSKAVEAGAAYSVGHGHGPVHHFHGAWSERALQESPHEVL
jgi:hydroxymethylpyrimidine/phosphomethylpyrimidine kinase